MNLQLKTTWCITAPALCHVLCCMQGRATSQRPRRSTVQCAPHAGRVESGSRNWSHTGRRSLFWCTKNCRANTLLWWWHLLVVTQNRTVLYWRTLKVWVPRRRWDGNSWMYGRWTSVISSAFRNECKTLHIPVLTIGCYALMYCCFDTSKKKETARVCWLQDLVLYSKLRLASLPQSFQTSHLNFLVNDMSSTHPQSLSRYVS